MKILIFVLVILFSIHHSFSQTVVKLVNKNKFNEAEEYCENKSCCELNNIEYFECYNCLADEHFKKNNFDLAFEYYQRSQNKEGIIKVGNAYIDSCNYENAYKCFESINYLNGIEKIGDVFFEKGEYINALNYYELSNSRNKIIKVGDIYLNNNEFDKAFNCYNKHAYIDGIIKIGDAYLDINNIEKALHYYDICDNNEGIGKVAKKMIANKKNIKLEINDNYPNANKKYINIPIFSTTKKVLSFTDFNLKNNYKDSILLKVTFDAYARKSEKYQGLYCGAEVDGFIELIIKNRTFFKIPFHNKKFNYHSDFIWLDYEGQYTSPNHAPFETTFLNAYLPQLFYLLTNISNNNFLLKALNNRNNDNIRCAAIYAIGENNITEYLPNLINLLKLSDDWDYEYNNLAIDEIYMALEAIRKITNGDYFYANSTYGDSVSKNHQYRKNTFFSWWEHYQSQKK